MQIIAADIGGTHSRIAWITSEWDLPASVEPVLLSYKNADFSDFYVLLKRFMQDIQQSYASIKRMVIALPAPIQGREIPLTNIDWVISQDQLGSIFPSAEISLINDFQAAAVGSVNESSENIIVINEGQPESKGPVVVTGAGTGLGVAWFADASKNALPHPCEGGHADYAPNSPEQLELYEFLSKQYGHVSYERILSGPGLSQLYRFVSNQADINQPADIIQWANGNDKTALKAIELFVQVFGAYVGNIALLFNPTSGIYLTGGMSLRLSGWFEQFLFIKHYQGKGRMRHVAESIPVYLVNHHNSGLNGAIHIAMHYRGDKP